MYACSCCCLSCSHVAVCGAVGNTGTSIIIRVVPRKDRAGAEYMGYDEADLAAEAEGAELERYERAFAGLPRAMWQLFKDPKDIQFPFHGSACGNADAVIDFDSDEDDRAD